jgi:two-component system sensor histidine kinase ChvG
LTSPPLRRRRRLRLFSPLTVRILAINLLAPVLLVAGVLYLDQYRTGLIDAQIDALFIQGDLMAGALAEAAVVPGQSGPRLDDDIARQIVRRLGTASETRVRLFDRSGGMVADSRLLIATNRDVVYRALPPPEQPGPLTRAWRWTGQAMESLFSSPSELPPYEEVPLPRAETYDEVLDALAGDTASSLRDAGDGRIIISVAVPVQGLRRVVGGLLLDTDSTEIEARVRSERLNILILFTLTFVVTTALSLFLASTIARPVRLLAAAAERVAGSTERQEQIPDFTSRRDEIGDLSEALSEMTRTLYARLDAIESFAADVSHEIKNPLTSIRSAIETMERTQDPEKQARLFDIIKQDVGRLNRLISDISDASRLDAELSRVKAEPVDLSLLLSAAVQPYHEAANPNGPVVELHLPETDPLIVRGLEGRLGQVVRNLLANAVSFSPPAGRIIITAWRETGRVIVTVEDEGPGIPPDKFEAIFDRFYSERPAGEAFGTHSGLGLSISRQIVERLGGSLTAENRLDEDGDIDGARFVLRLPG